MSRYTGPSWKLSRRLGYSTLETGKELAVTEAFLTGISSGAALWAATELAKKSENEGKTIVVLLPDSGDRYLSTALYSE